MELGWAAKKMKYSATITWRREWNGAKERLEIGDTDLTSYFLMNAQYN